LAQADADRERGGLDQSVPNGRKPRGSPKRSADKGIARTQAIIEREPSMAKALEAVTVMEQEVATIEPRSPLARELLDNAKLGLKRVREMLEAEIPIELTPAYAIALAGRLLDAAGMRL
jgi:hypothetical protein